jgi:putative NADH-flavin reductase
LPNKLKQKITLIGSTGLIGSQFLKEISSDDYQSVNAITRRRISNLGNKNFIKQYCHDFSDLEKMRTDLKTDVLVSALGTTIKKAGSKDKFLKIDHDLPMEISKIAKEEGCITMILIYSMGASSTSKIFYNRVKGLLEES